MRQEFTIDGMHCGACVKRVKGALSPLSATVDVTLNPPRAILESSSPLSPEIVLKAVASAGNYRASAVSLKADLPDQTTNPALSLPDAGFFATYQPLLVIIALITLVAFAAGRDPDGFSWHMAMNAFMAGFFLVFAGFKLFDLSGFAQAYSTYDLLAARWHPYGLIYPFLELALGICYLFNLAPFWTNTATLILMGFSSLGVIAALMRKQSIQCACLGTSLKLPMSTVTLVEDGAMVVMAAAMLIWWV